MVFYSEETDGANRLHYTFLPLTTQPYDSLIESYTHNMVYPTNYSSPKGSVLKYKLFSFLGG